MAKSTRPKVGDTVQVFVSAEVIMKGRAGYMYNVKNPVGLSMYRDGRKVIIGASVVRKILFTKDGRPRVNNIAAEALKNALPFLDYCHLCAAVSKEKR